MTDVGRAAVVTVGAATAALIADRVAKTAIERTLGEGEAARGPLGIHLHRVSNTRGVLGSPVGSDGTGLLVGAALAGGIAGAGVLLRRPALLQIGTGLVAGGIAANLIDRARGRGVTDFLPSPLGVLNLGDVALGAGIACAIVGIALRR